MPPLKGLGIHKQRLPSVPPSAPRWAIMLVAPAGLRSSQVMLLRRPAVLCDACVLTVAVGLFAFGNSCVALEGALNSYRRLTQGSAALRPGLDSRHSSGAWFIAVPATSQTNVSQQFGHSQFHSARAIRPYSCQSGQEPKAKSGFTANSRTLRPRPCRRQHTWSPCHSVPCGA